MQAKPEKDFDLYQSKAKQSKAMNCHASKKHGLFNAFQAN
jgi:hypothetical protein